MALTEEQVKAILSSRATLRECETVTKEQVISILSSHDVIRDNNTRAAVVRYLHDAFTKAEKYDALAEQVAQEAEHTTFVGAGLDALVARVTALEAK